MRTARQSTHEGSLKNRMLSYIRFNGGRERFYRLRNALLRCAIFAACVVAFGSVVFADTTSSISANFNGTGMAAGDTIWFSSVLKPSGLGGNPVTVFVRKSTISFTANGANYTVPVPDANITFSPSVTTATISFDSTKNLWQATVPSTGLAGNTFLDAAEFMVPSGGLPGGIQNVTWQANFSTDTSGISIQWQWAAAVYTSFSTNYGSLGVKPVDDNKASQYQNSDHAGTPENFESNVIGGARGGGGSNYTGSYSGTVSLALPVVQPPAARIAGPSNGFVAQAISFNGSGSSDPSGYPLNYSWNFGDGATATGVSASHTYSSAGTFTVTLTVDDGRNVDGSTTSTANITFPPPPIIIATLTPAPNADGWNNTNVTVTFTCSDTNVGILSCASPVTLTGEGANQVVQGTAVNNAGVVGTASPKINIDKTPPTIAASVSPIPNSAGWDNANVTVTFSCSDSRSGVARCPQPILISSSGANQTVSGTATDFAGNTSTPASVTLNVELTLPSIVGSASPLPNPQGWNNTNVTVSFACTQSSSPITNCPAPQTISTEGADQSVSGTVTDAAGNSNTGQVNLNIAKTPPVITAAISPQPNGNGWNNSPATVNFTCTKTTAPLATCPQPQSVSTEGANQAIPGSVSDVAGNSASTTAHVYIATTPPTITASVSPQPNANGWNNSVVTVTFNCVATTAPIASCPQPETISTEGAGQVIAGTATDVAGNSATAKVMLNIALTPPKIVATASPGPDASGWNNSSVTVSFVCTNTTAPIATCPPPQTISAEGAGQTISGTATDVAGNSATASVTLNIGTKPPTIVPIPAPPPNAAGWNNSNVTVSFACAPGTAPIATCPPPITLAMEGANQNVTGAATDAAGNSVTTSLVLNIDKTPPTISYNVSPAPNSNGINTTTPVTITFTCSDALSGVAACPSPISVTTPGMNQVFTGTASDVAGNAASATATVNVQTAPPPSAPSISAVVSPAANAKGWNNSDVTVSFTCVPGSNPLASCSSPILVPTEGANQSFCGRAVDSAGLSTQACATVSLDKTPPAITVSQSPAASGSGWNNTPVTVTFSCTDSLSEIATCPPPQNVSTDGNHQVINGTAADVAGNSSTAQITLNIQQVPPTILQFTAPAQIAPGQSGTATVTASDSLSGLTAVVFQLNGTTLGTVTAPPYAVNFTAPTTANAGDTLTLTVSVSDAAGNASSSSRGIQVVLAGVLTGQVLSDATGLPFAGASVQIIGGSTPDTSDNTGRYSLPSNASHLFLSISTAPNASAGIPATVTVEREMFLQSGVGTVPVDARLTSVSALTSIGTSGGSLTAGALTIAVAPGAVASATNFHLTLLSPQGLPGLLPLGWSPITAFDLRADTSTSASFNSTVTQLLSSLTLHLVRYDYSTHAWLMVTPNLGAVNGALTIPIPSVGDFALVTADVGNSAIVVPSSGQALAGVNMVALPAGSAATGSLNPPSVSPTGGTSVATLAVQSSVPLPSGTVIQANVQETYSLISGKQLSDAKRTEDILLYQYSAPSGAAAVASFPVTPSQTFPLEQLSSGNVHLDILSGRESVRGQVGGSDAVTVTGGDATLLIAAGSSPQDTAIAVTPEPVDGFLPATTSLIPLAEYNLDFSGQTLNVPAQLSVAAGSAQPGDNFLLAQIQRLNGIPYLVVVSLAQVNGTTLVTQGAPGLSGLTQGGDYIFYKLTSPTGYVSGTVTSSSGPVPAMVQTDGLPFVTFTGASGSYLIPALAGTVNLSASVPKTAVAGSGTVQVTAGQTATANLLVTGQTESATITPLNGSVGVPLTPEIDITVPDAFDQTSVLSTNVTLTQNAQGTNTLVPVRFVFSQGGSRLAVFPLSALQPSTTYTFAASGVANLLGGLIVVPTVTFTTQANTPPNFNTDALVFGMPDQNGNTQISAPANSFPPGTTILIVDQTNGVVLSLTVANDGSVTGQMPATVNDLLVITITDPAGNKTTITRSQFVAPDGTIAIGPGGGSITGPGGTGLVVPAGAVDHGVQFKLTQMDPTTLPDGPAVDGLQIGGWLRVQVTGTKKFSKELKLIFPVPSGAPGGAQYYVYRRVTFADGSIGYEVIDEAVLQGSGSSAQVVTASPPFPGFEQVLDALGVNDFILAWWIDLANPGYFTQGAITGKVLGSSYQPGSTAAVTAGIEGAHVYTQKPGVVDSATRKSVFATSQPHGTYTLWDPNFKGGTITVYADSIPSTYLPPSPSLPYQTTAYEILRTDTLWTLIKNTLLGTYLNVATGDITVPPPAPPQPPPAFLVSVVQDTSTRSVISGVTTVGSPLIIGINPQPGSTQGVAVNATTITVNGQSVAVGTDSQVQFAVIAHYAPPVAGVYTIQVTVLNAFGGPPTIVSNTFRVIGTGGTIAQTTPGTPPSILTDQSYPTNGATGVSVNVAPLVTFSEPVTIPAGSIQLQDSFGTVLLVTIGGVDVNGNPYADITQAGPGTAFTSVTIQPLQNLRYSLSPQDPYGTYKIILNQTIQDLNQPPIPLVASSSPIIFSTYQIPVLSTGGAEFASPGIFVARDRAYVAEITPGTLSRATVWQYNVNNPANPAAIGPASDGSIEGRADYVTGEDNSVEAGGKTLIAVSVAPYPIAPDAPAQTSHVMLYKGISSATAGDTDSLSWIGAVSLTSGVLDGIVSSIAVKGNRLYAATIRKGIQVVDLDQVIAEFQGVSDPVINYAINTEGQGFATDAVIATIGLQNDPSLEYLDDLLDIKVAVYPAAGGENQTLTVATGWVPSSAGSATGVSFVVADPNAQTIVSETMPQSASGSLTRGVALALGPIQSAAGTLNIAAVVGNGTASNCASPCMVLAVIDMTIPASPKPLSFTALTGVPMSVVLNGNTAIIGYSIDTADIFDLSNPASPVFLGSIVSVGGSLFLYNGELFSTGAVPGVSNSALGGVHIAQLSYVPFTLTAINFTGDCSTVLKPAIESQMGGAGCFYVYNDTVGGNLVIGDTLGTSILSKNPAWQPSAGLPIGYVKGQTMKLEVKMTQNPVPVVSSTLTITGKGGPGLGDCTWTGPWPLTPTFTFTCTMTTAKAMAYNAINWTYSSSGAPVFIGITSLPIYVTLNSPLQYTSPSYTGSSPYVFHTTLNLALSGTESTDQASAFNNTWNQFSTGGTGPANIQTWQGRKLYYYRNDPNGILNTTIIGFNGCAVDEGSLLLNEAGESGSGAVGHNSGQCGSFAHLLIGALAANGIHSAWTVVSPVNTNLEFLAKSWSPPDSNTNSNGPWNLCIPPGDPMVPAQPNGVYCDLTSLGTLVGQNTAPPSEKIFLRHFIVKPQGVSGVPTYVDPSYGVKYDSAADFERKAVTGYFDPDPDHVIGHVPNPLNSQNPLSKYSVSKPDPTNVGISLTP